MSIQGPTGAAVPPPAANGATASAGGVAPAAEFVFDASSVDGIAEILDTLTTAMNENQKQAKKLRHLDRDNQIGQLFAAAEKDLAAATKAFTGAVVGGLAGVVGAGVGMKGACKSMQISKGPGLPAPGGAAGGLDDVSKAISPRTSALGKAADRVQTGLKHVTESLNRVSESLGKVKSMLPGRLTGGASASKGSVDDLAKLDSNARNTVASATADKARNKSEALQAVGGMAQGGGEFAGKRDEAEASETRALAEKIKANVDDLSAIVEEFGKTMDKAMGTTDNMQRSNHEATRSAIGG